MALATQCPHCHTKFRVAADQLKLRGGIVRCGACQAIFDGSAHLIDLDAPAAVPAPSPAPAPAEPVEAEAESPVYTLELGHTLDPLGILPQALEPQEDGSGRIEPTFGLPVDEELVAQPVRGDEPLDEVIAEPAPSPEPEPETEAAPEPDPTEPEPAPGEPAADEPAAPAPAADAPPAALPLRASTGNGPVIPAAGIPPPPPALKRAGKGGGKSARRSKLTPTRIEAPKLRVPESDEPEFVKRSKRQEQLGRLRRVLLPVGVAVLLLLLAAQAVLEFRNVLAARFPATRPLLAAGCMPFGCRVGLPAQVENLAIETGELSPLGSNTYTLNTLLRNNGSLVEAWPSISLELVDDANQPLLRRVFKPADYVPAAARSGGFAARSEQPVRLDFALAGPTPAGYHLFVFYP